MTHLVALNGTIHEFAFVGGDEAACFEWLDHNAPLHDMIVMPTVHTLGHLARIGVPLVDLTDDGNPRAQYPNL